VIPIEGGLLELPFNSGQKSITMKSSQPHINAVSDNTSFHVVTVGFDRNLVPNLWNRISARSKHSFSHIVHPTYDRRAWGKGLNADKIYFFREDMGLEMPPADRQLLASLEQEDVPTVHNMIMSDRIVSELEYGDALAYATFLAQRMLELFDKIRPSVIIGAFDALHGSVAFAVAKRMGIPWFALNFSSIPKGLTCFCNTLSPASQVTLGFRPDHELRSLAERVLGDFEANKIQAPAYITPDYVNPSYIVRGIPAQIKSLFRTLNRGRLGKFRKFTDSHASYSVRALLKESIRNRINLILLPRRSLLETPPAEPYVFFGLHMQPESSIDVWTHFYSNQVRVIEVMSRSIPPTHKLLVKLHKSDVTNYSPSQLAQFCQFPGVRLVSPFADTRALIQNAAVIFSIQGTMGLEAALLGKPVVMFGDSPVKIFPSVSMVGKITDLPNLIREKLAERAPDRTEIVDAFIPYLAPFYPVSFNDWTVLRTDAEIDGYVNLLESLERFVRKANVSAPSAGPGK
jgi:capsular polysaccharide biosynthesis protein